MPTYAKDTTVSAERSRAEIETILDRYGASKFAYMRDEHVAVIGFSVHQRSLRFVLPLPDKNDFQMTPGGKRRTQNSINEAYEQAVRQRWRALTLVIKAKLESVESGIETFEQAFLGNIVLPGGQTVAEWMIPQIASAYNTGAMPPLLTSEVSRND